MVCDEEVENGQKTGSEIKEVVKRESKEDRKSESETKEGETNNGWPVKTGGHQEFGRNEDSARNQLRWEVAFLRSGGNDTHFSSECRGSRM